MTTPDIAKEVQAALANDRDAFGRLVERHQGLVFGICYRLTNSVHDAEDLAHEAFVEAYVKLRTLREPGKFASWLKTLTLNLCRMWYRRNRRDPVELRAEVPALVTEEPAEDDPVYGRMWYGLSQLSLDHRLALVLHYVEGLSYEAVATFLDVPVGTVMSRLHRARHNLKKQIEDLQEVDVIPMIIEEQFREEVDAEVSVLLEMFQDDPTAMERLSTILSAKPERLSQLMRGTEDAQTLSNLAVLLPRLGAPAMEVMLQAAMGTDPVLQANALRVLCGFTAECRSVCGSVPPWNPTASFDAYTLTDLLIRHSASQRTKVDLLLDLLEPVTDPATGTLLSEVLLCYHEEAYSLLLERFWQIEDPADVYRKDRWVAVALRATGTRFCRDLTAALSDADPHRTGLALAGLDELAKGTYAHLQRQGVPSVRGARWVFETDDPALVSLVQLDRSAIDEAAAAVERFLADPDGGLRNTAIRVLARFESRRHIAVISGCLHHDEVSTRVRAIQALSDLDDADSADALIVIAGGGEPVERRAAIEALGRLEITAAEGDLVRYAQDVSSEIRKAAVIALGELCTTTATTEIKKLLTSRDRVARSAASRALHGSHQRRRPQDDAQCVEETPREMRLRRTFGPIRPVHHISVDAAIRAVPEIRAYDEAELTRHIARVCGDRSATRRRLVEHRIVRRSGAVYELTEVGEAAWRVEHFIMEHFMQ